jgi:predicted O-linked N-acetylglucosamine transferase (SPINDLY family)
MVDPHSFSLWMQMLRALPDAILLMPGFAPAARANLQREAQAAGIAAERLVFMPRLTRAETLARMGLTDLFVDTVRCNANHGLVDALRMGVPAVTCAGETMASRLGGSIVRAAGLQDCVYNDEAAYLDAVLRLGRNRNELQALRARLQAGRPQAALFDTAHRIREWEAAWTTMIERQRSGLAPAAFDVAPQG